MVKNSPAMQETWVRSLVWEDLLEKGMATHFSILACRIPRTEEPGRLQSMGLQRIGRNWAIFTSFHLVNLIGAISQHTFFRSMNSLESSVISSWRCEVLGSPKDHWPCTWSRSSISHDTDPQKLPPLDTWYEQGYRHELLHRERHLQHHHALLMQSGLAQCRHWVSENDTETTG